MATARGATAAARGAMATARCGAAHQRVRRPALVAPPSVRA